MQEAFAWKAQCEDKGWYPDYSWAQAYFGAVTVLLTSPSLNEQQREVLIAKMDFFVGAHLEEGSNESVRRTPKGLTFMSEWGSLRHACGVAALLARYARYLDSHDMRVADVLEFAEQQVRSRPAMHMHGRHGGGQRTCVAVVTACYSAAVFHYATALCPAAINVLRACRSATAWAQLGAHSSLTMAETRRATRTTATARSPISSLASGTSSTMLPSPMPTP